MEVPSYFLCPISLEMMRDPVTLSTGVSYERSAIQAWLSGQKNEPTCPVTNQPLSSPELIPNLTLRRLIHSLPDPKRESFEELSRLVERGGVRRKAALKALFQASGCRRSRVEAVAAGGVAAVVQVLLEEGDRGVCEMAMVALERLCGCAEGRGELVRHPAGVAVVGKKAIRVSPLATEKAVKILHSVAKLCGQEMLHVGVVAKLCLVLQSDCRSKTKERAREILRSNSRIWRNSPCIPPILQASYACNLIRN